MGGESFQVLSVHRQDGQPKPPRDLLGVAPCGHLDRARADQDKDVAMHQMVEADLGGYVVYNDRIRSSASHVPAWQQEARTLEH
jgi:hypothetical protein